MKVKVCGVRTYRDAALALDLGVDALGFNFYRRSPRFTSPADARAIIKRLPPFVATVGVFVNVGDPRLVEEAARDALVQVLQLHGDETAEYCSRFPDWPVIKAIRIGHAPLEAKLEAYPVRAFLLDSKDDQKFGGTGRGFDWRIAASLSRHRPVILAGGLKPGNVAAAIRTVKPYGVDVCSGVESEPGTKDRRKLTAFMIEVRDAGR